MRDFQELLDEAVAADVSGWGFDWLTGRATEERPPWRYSALLAERLHTVDSALDVDTGGGEILAEMPSLPPRMAATESWPPNARRTRQTLSERGVEVVETTEGAPLPFPDKAFDLVTARHPVHPDWQEIGRVLTPGGRYFAQHVGPGSAFDLIERFLGPLPVQRRRRDPVDEAAAARDAGLIVTDLRTARCRMTFHDVGAIVWILRKCVWWVPDFSVDGYRCVLAELDAQMRRGDPVVAHSTRHLIEAQRPSTVDSPL